MMLGEAIVMSVEYKEDKNFEMECAVQFSDSF